MMRKELMLLRRSGDVFPSEMDDDEGSVLAMDVDDDVDVEPLELFNEPFHPHDFKKLVDSNFFNSFDDDFDDADIN